MRQNWKTTKVGGRKKRKCQRKVRQRENVTIIIIGEERYDRTLEFVFFGDVCVNKELLKLGLARHYKFYNKEPELAKLEEVARKNWVVVIAKSFGDLGF